MANPWCKLSSCRQPRRIGVAIVRRIYYNISDLVKWALDNMTSSGDSLYLFPRSSHALSKANVEHDELVNQCQRICSARQVKFEVRILETDVIHIEEELMSQIIQLGIVKMVLGTSLFRSSSQEQYVTSSLLANAPSSCIVIVIDYNNLNVIETNDVTYSISSTIQAPTAASSTTNETILEDDTQATLPASHNEEQASSSIPIELQGQYTNVVRNCDDSLNDMHNSKKKTREETRDYCTRLLEQVKEMVEATLTEEETWRQKALYESKQHQETRIALEASIEDAKAARQQAKAALEELGETKKVLELEIKSRKVVQERANTSQQTQQRYREYSFKDLQMATHDFSEENKVGEGGHGHVYKGKLHNTNVAIKVLAQDGVQGRKLFQHEVELLSQIHHPHIVMLLGACLERGCIVYEYMGNGSLEDRLDCKSGTPPIPWYVRVRICSEVATALLFLHSQPTPIVHCDLKPGNILMDHNFVSKVGNVGIGKFSHSGAAFTGVMTRCKETVRAGTFAYIDPDYQRTGVVSCESDVYGLGIIMLQLLTGKPAVGVAHLVEEAVDNGQLHEVVDRSAGEWPLPEAMELACLSLQCAEPKRKNRPSLKTRVIETLESIQKIADAAAVDAARVAWPPHANDGELIIPSLFMCPISQEIMKHPHIAADGFTYEEDAITAWLATHSTSPMTNLQLSHKNLLPNLSLKSAIKEWQEKHQLSN